MNDDETSDLARQAEDFVAAVQAVLAASGDGPPRAPEPSDIQGRTIFDYAVLSGLLGRGSLPLVRAERSEGAAWFVPLSDKSPLRDAATAWFQSAPDEEGTFVIESADLVRERDGVYARLLFGDDRAVERIELRAASGLPVALANALPAL